ncbi:MAG: beta-N-acetylhexosaminidase [Cytophagales bacterium]|nr:beta-N-acetylhexosaminidase [Cytophagales bacterium]
MTHCFKKTRLFLLILFIFPFEALHAQKIAEVNNVLGIVPRPEKVKAFKKKGFELNEKVQIVADEASVAVADYLSEFLNNPLGIKLPVEERSRRGFRNIVLKTKNSSGAKEGYSLRVSSKKIEIIGNSPAGVFYGAQTLLQLLPPAVFSDQKQTAEWKIPAVEIKDKPFFETFRGLHVDVSRHFRTKQQMLEIIDQMAMHKLNTLHLHLTDDQGWRVEIKSYPKLTEIGSVGEHSHVGKGERMFFTQEDIKEIVAYAKKRYIKIIPEVDMPGHMMAAIRSYPELKSPSDLRKQVKVIRIDEQGERFCKAVLKELDGLFESEYIHIGFDEINLGSKKKIYNDEEITAFARKISEYIKNELKKTPIVWDDAFEKGLHDTETLVHWWRYGKVHWWRNLELTMDEKVQKYNQPFILSPANRTYLDMRNAKGAAGGGWAGIVSVDKIYQWQPLGDLTHADPSKFHLAQGIITCTWSEMIKTVKDFQDRAFPRLAAVAEKAWAQPGSKAPSKPSWEEWRDQILIPKQLKRYEYMNIHYWSRNDLDQLRKLKGEK